MPSVFTTLAGIGVGAIILFLYQTKDATTDTQQQRLQTENGKPDDTIKDDHGNPLTSETYPCNCDDIKGDYSYSTKYSTWNLRIDNTGGECKYTWSNGMRDVTQNLRKQDDATKCVFKNDDTGSDNFVFDESFQSVTCGSATYNRLKSQ